MNKIVTEYGCQNECQYIVKNKNHILLLLNFDTSDGIVIESPKEFRVYYNETDILIGKVMIKNGNNGELVYIERYFHEQERCVFTLLLTAVIASFIKECLNTSMPVHHMQEHGVTW